MLGLNDGLKLILKLGLRDGEMLSLIEGDNEGDSD